MTLAPRSLRARRARQGYALLVALVLIAVLTLIGSTSLSVAGIDDRIAQHNRRSVVIVNAADAGTHHARYQLQTENPADEGWDTADAGDDVFVATADAETSFEGTVFGINQGSYAVRSTYVKCSRPPPGYSTEEGNATFRADYWDMQSDARFLVPVALTQLNPFQATVVSTLQKVTMGPCKIR